ncbi:transposase, partial [Mangrovicoccus sp. HB161399]|uniref:transposase n=1 Tax=Mangrovicoccus sp. HB161399 TaxID=2720392 RepID=UPI0020A698B3
MKDLFWLTEAQMERIRPFFLKSHGRPRADDRRALSGIVFSNRIGLRWRDAPSECRPHKTLCNRWFFLEPDGERPLRDRDLPAGSRPMRQKPERVPGGDRRM